MGLPGCYLKERSGEWLGKMTALRWQEEKGMRQAKLFIGEQPNKTWLAEVRKLERRRQRLVVGWLTGHWRVNYHLSKLGFSWTMDCRWFHVEEETTEHFLCGCLAWAELQKRFLDLLAWKSSN